MLRKLFKGGNYSRAETIRENTVNKKRECSMMASSTLEVLTVNKKHVMIVPN